MKYYGQYMVHFWPDTVSFDVAGLFTSVDLVMLVDDCAYSKFGRHLPIKSVYGSPACKWNGGRVAFKTVTESDICSEYTLLAERKWIPCLSFSNHLLTGADVSDLTGNQLLACADKFFDAYLVRVCSPVLAEFIRKEHPKAQVCASVILADLEHGAGDPSYYLRLAGQFDRFVLHPDDNLNTNIRSVLDPHRAEFLLNERCLFACPNRVAHYDAIATIQQKGDTYQYMQDRVLERCGATPLDKQVKSPLRNCCLSKVELHDLIESGFFHFKIQGRRDERALFLYDLCNYLLPDEYMTSQLFSPLLVHLTSGSARLYADD